MSPLVLHTPQDSPIEDILSKTFTRRAYFLPNPSIQPQMDTQSQITMKEQGILSTHLRSGRPVYVDTDYLSVASVAAVSR